MRIRIKYSIITFISITLFTVTPSIAIDGEKITTEKLFELPFDELLQVKIASGTLVNIDDIKKPVSVTTITSRQIQQTPFRNLYDLIEVYAPGAMWMNHWDSPSLGIRGVISDRNNKILVLINGRNANLKARGGGMSELENWDMDDIDRIEIIRGPGSVTYGPGAVAGVINIISKKSGTNDYDGIKFSGVYPYKSYGGSFKLSSSLTENIDMFSYFSLTSTKGYSPDKAISFFTSSNYGILGKDLDMQPLDYYNDYNDEPQIKLHLDFDYDKHTRLWIRYIKSGATRLGAFNKARPQIGIDENGYGNWGDWLNHLAVKNEHFYITLDNETNISNSMKLKSLISWDSENNARRKEYFQPYSLQDSLPGNIIDQLQDLNSLRMKYNNFSESELLTKFVLQKECSQKFSCAFGTEISYNSWGAPWFEDDNMIRMGDSRNIISGPESPAYGYPFFHGVDSSEAIFVGDGWSTLTYSLFAETKYEPLKALTILLSGRMDKDSYSELLFSPRIAFVYELNENNYIKVIAQESNRMNTAEEMYLQNLHGVTSSPEILKTIEAIYNSVPMDDCYVNLSMFYNNYDVISWYDPIRTTRTTGNLSLAGAEIDIRINLENIDLGFSHAYAKQIEWELAENIKTSGISYSDYKFNYLGNEIFGVGNDLNNWSNHSTKIFFNAKLFDDKLLFHLDSRIFWNYKGAKDGLDLINEISKNTEKEEDLEELLSYLSANGIYNTDFRINALIKYMFFEKLQASVYFLNILDVSNNYRYKYDSGNKAENYMVRSNAIAEPFTIGLSLTYKL